MVYTNPIVRTDGDNFFDEDPIAVIEAENANILHGGYEPLPQEPEVTDYNVEEEPDEDYCPLQDEDDSKLDTFCYYIKHPEPPKPREDYNIPARRKPFPQPIISQSQPESLPEDQAGPSGTKIDMDAEKVEEVKKIMVNINLPPSYFPEWTEDVPEEQWKDFILQRLHLKKSKQYAD